MSSTNRGYDRHKSDYYVTPIIPIEEFMYEFQYRIIQKDSNYMSNLKWLDPCCGGDKDNVASYVSVIKDFYEPNSICTIDIREDSRAAVKEDYLRLYSGSFDFKPDVIISNPPFYKALEFIKKSLEIVADGGYVVMLLRLNFFGSKKRKPFFEELLPNYCFIHSKRMSFNDSGKTDSIEYAHFVWRKGHRARYCKTLVI